MQRSTLITGILFVASGAMSAGVSYWISAGFDSVPGSSYDVAAGLNRWTPPIVPSELWVANGAPSREPPLPGPIATSYTISKNVPEVRLQFTVSDERGRLVPDLSLSDLRIFDDHVPVNNIRQFEKLSDLPLRVGILLDVSDSMKLSLDSEKSLALAFLQRILRPATDRAFVLAFGDTVQISQEPTSEMADLMGAVKQASAPGHSTDLFDAVYSGCVSQWKSAESGPVHRVMILISDGEDTGSRHMLSEVIAAAQGNEIQIYTLNLHLKKGIYPGDEVLQKLADETGGRFFVASNARAADAIFSQLEQELRTQYYVSFRPADQLPGYHMLQLQIQNPRKLMVRARHGYYALSQ